MQQATITLMFSTTLGCALMAGLFFVFSVAVMRALAQLPAHQGIKAMQTINTAIVNPVFLAVFLGTALGCVTTIILGVMQVGQVPWLAVVGALVYLMGSLVVTAAFNIPRNNRLAALAPTDASSAVYWSTYLAEWTAWNHVRSLAALVATGLLILAMR